MSARDVIANAAYVFFLDETRKTGGVADAILSALDAAGYAVVSKEPTQKMVKAALSYIVDDAPCANPHGVFKAMLAAAKETP